MPKLLTLCLLAFLSPTLVGAETASQRNGTDLFLSGTSGLPELNTTGDVFAAGQSVVLKGKAGGDAHAAGFDVSVEAPIAGNLYVAGANVAVLAPVAQDLTAMGMNLRTSAQATIAGNARLAGSNVVIDGPIMGALTVTAGEITLNAAVTGDVLMLIDTASFGPNARISGRLTYSAAEPITVPASLIPANRVTYHRLVLPETVTRIRQGWRVGHPMMPSARAVMGGAVLILAGLLAVGAITLAMAPVWSDRVRQTIDAKSGACLLAGVLGLAALLGLVPVTVMTIIGIPLLPLVFATILLGWMMSYLFGVYALSMRVARVFGISEPVGLSAQILVLALGLLGSTLLNFVPILGWLLNFVPLLLGAGAIVLLGLRSPVAAPAASA